VAAVEPIEAGASNRKVATRSGVSQILATRRRRVLAVVGRSALVPIRSRRYRCMLTRGELGSWRRCWMSTGLGLGGSVLDAGPDQCWCGGSSEWSTPWPSRMCCCSGSDRACRCQAGTCLSRALLSSRLFNGLHYALKIP
jgi:hypothetical protein